MNACYRLKTIFVRLYYNLTQQFKVYLFVSSLEIQRKRKKEKEKKKTRRGGERKEPKF